MKIPDDLPFVTLNCDDDELKRVGSQMDCRYEMLEKWNVCSKFCYSRSGTFSSLAVGLQIPGLGYSSGESR